MRGTKTKTGRVSLALSLIERAKLWEDLICFLEPESVKLTNELRTESQVMRKLYYHTLEGVLQLNWKLQFNKELRIIFTQPQAIAMLWLLREHDSDLTMLHIKSGLHKLLI